MGIDGERIFMYINIYIFSTYRGQRPNGERIETKWTDE